jgi:hypothetical protein
MRWARKTYYSGDIRVRSGFLLIPKCIRSEWRWLERAEWSEEFNGYDGGWYAHKWVNP